MSPPCPTDEPVQFLRCVVWGLARVDLATPRHHLLGGKPDSEVPELDTPGAVGPPEQTQLCDGEKNEAPERLARPDFGIDGGDHSDSLLCGRTDHGRPLPREGSSEDTPLL